MSPLKVRCRCGRHLIVKPELVGQSVVCPACRSVLTLNAPAAEAAQQKLALVTAASARGSEPVPSAPTLEEAPKDEAPPRRINGWTILLAVVLLFNLVLLGYFLIWQPLQARYAQPEAGAEVSLGEVVLDYTDSQRIGDRRWKGRRLRVAGFIEEAKEAGKVSAHVWLHTGREHHVCCFFPASQQEAFARLAAADRVVIDGDLTAVETHAGLRAKLFLHNCRVVPAAAP